MAEKRRNIVITKAGRKSLESQGREDEKKAPNGLTDGQWDRFKKIAQAKDIPANMLLRQVAQWYLDGIDRNVSNVDDRALFDETMEKEITK